jgi:hypothetical protein
MQQISTPASPHQYHPVIDAIRRMSTVFRFVLLPMAPRPGMTVQQSTHRNHSHGKMAQTSA